MYKNTNSDKIRIVHIIGSLRFGGAQQLLVNLLNTDIFAEFDNFILTIIHSSNSATLRHVIPLQKIYKCFVNWPTEESQIPSYKLRKWLRHALHFTFKYRLKDTLKKLQPHIVHSHIVSEIDIQSETTLKGLNIPFIWTVHGMYKSRFKDNSKLIEKVDDAIKLINKHKKGKIVGVSKAVLEDIFNKKKISERKALVIYNGVPLEKYGKTRKKDVNWLKKYNIPEDAVIFGAAGRLVLVKRYDLIIKAAKMILEKFKDVYFVIAGDGPLYSSLQKEIQKNKVNKRVILTGFQADMPHFFQQIDVFVNVSESEGLPLALLEALASGIPVIATDVGGISEVIDTTSGILIPKNSVEALVEAISRMLRNEDRQKLKKGALIAARKFSIENTARKYVELYKEMVKEL